LSNKKYKKDLNEEQDSKNPANINPFQLFVANDIIIITSDSIIGEYIEINTIKFIGSYNFNGATELSRLLIIFSGFLSLFSMYNIKKYYILTLNIS
jgi:hypothetical protein|tara:strand:+ start:665 stop:952 length:288 start_codon:yes stop_codon:yes gene_type:complete